MTQFILKFFIATAVLFSISANAQEKSAPPLPSACSDDAVKFCSDKKAPRDVAKCLLSRAAELNPQCKQEIERYIQMMSGAEERGGGALTSFGGSNAMGPPIPLITYSGRVMPGEGEKNPSYSEHKVDFSVPVYKAEGYTIGSSLAAGQLHLGETVKLDNGRELPTDLHRYEVGAQYFSQLSDKRMLTVRASAGYVGDKPSVANKDASYSINLTYGKPASGNGYWIYALYMSNNSPFINFFPIPGVIYMYRTPTFTGLFGLPVLSLQWTPEELWSYSFSLFVTNVQSEIAYGQRNQFQTFLHYSFNQQSYILHQREQDRDRLTLQDQKLAAGFRSVLMKKMQLEFQAGRSFDRTLYIGKGFMNKDRGSATIDADWFGSLGIKVAF